MKNKSILLIATALLLTGCLNQLYSSPSFPEGFNKKLVTIFAANPENGKIIEQTGFPIGIKNSNNVPYISIKNAFEFLGEIRKENIGKSAYYKLNNNNGIATITNERNATCIFDKTKKNITFSDFDSFITQSGNDYIPFNAYTPSANTKSISLNKEKSIYTAGKEYVIDLNKYKSIDIIDNSKGDYFIPLQTFNDLFLSHFGLSFGYNFKDLYLLGNNSLGSVDKPSELAKKYYNAPNNVTLNQDYIQFSYDELCLNIDYNYGLKDRKNISTADIYLESIGAKTLLNSLDAKQIDRGLYKFCYQQLDDHHTGLSATSPLYPRNEFVKHEEDMLEKTNAWYEADEALKKARKAENKITPFEVIDDTAYIYFDSFTGIDEKLLYKSTWNNEEIAKSDAILFAYAYKEITKANSGVRNVVIDIATNDGGSVDSCIFDIATIVGEFNIELLNPQTGAYSKSFYNADINLDGKIDNNDVPLAANYNIILLNSNQSFSCGNLLPVTVKHTNPNKVKTLGETTGGGTCVLANHTTAIGATFSTSGLRRLSYSVDGQVKDIEDGIPADYELSRNDFFNRNQINTLINSTIFPKN